MRGGDFILSIQVKKHEVIDFLENLKRILTDTFFDSNKDFFMVIHGKVDDTSHSTLFTLTDLGYGREDVIKCLMGLSVEEYSETRLDRDDMDPLFLYIFGKMINRKLVYIKLKIRESDRNQVVCVSFHYAKQNMTFPYA